MQTTKSNTENAIEELNHLNRVLADKSAFVPEPMAGAVVAAASAVGVALCGGIYDPETDMRVLYVA